LPIRSCTESKTEQSLEKKKAVRRQSFGRNFSIGEAKAFDRFD